MSKFKIGDAAVVISGNTLSSYQVEIQKITKRGIVYVRDFNNGNLIKFDNNGMEIEGEAFYRSNIFTTNEAYDAISNESNRRKIKSLFNKAFLSSSELLDAIKAAQLIASGSLMPEAAK